MRELADRPAVRDDDEDAETIKRTLVLAQKTADAAVKEAKEEAQRTLTEAQQKADTLVGDAQVTSQRIVSEAELEARKTSEETRQRMADEIVALEEAREALKADHGILERHLEEQRLRLRSVDRGTAAPRSTTRRSCAPPRCPSSSGASSAVVHRAGEQRRRTGGRATT